MQFFHFVVGILLGLALVDVVLVVLDHLLEGGLESVVDGVVLRGLGQVSDQARLQLRGLVALLFLEDLHGLGLQPVKGHVLVLHQALADQGDRQVALVVDRVELDGLELVLQQGLGQHHKSWETSVFADNDDIVLPDAVLSFEIFFASILLSVLLAGSRNFLGLHCSFWLLDLTLSDGGFSSFLLG